MTYSLQIDDKFAIIVLVDLSSTAILHIKTKTINDLLHDYSTLLHEFQKSFSLVHVHLRLSVLPTHRVWRQGRIVVVHGSSVAGSALVKQEISGL